ncbi:MAG: hypothetical protein ACPG06_05640 [Alphaproteobacteria bacterium]
MLKLLEFSARGPVMGLSFLLTALLVGAIFPNIPVAGQTLLDLLPAYDRALIQNRILEYGDEWRVMQIWSSLSVDAVFPLIYGLFFIGIAYRLRIGEWGKWLTLPAFLLVGVDYAENIQIATLLLNWPDISDSRIAIASATTGIKNALTQINLLISLILIVKEAGIWSVRSWRRTG